MNKKAQVTVFIILGIVLVALLILFLYFKSTFYIGAATPENIRKELFPIKEHIEDCLSDIASKYIILIGQQGGYIITPEGTYRLYNSSHISYLCYNMEDKDTCMNRMLTIDNMETSLSKAIKDELSTQCIQLEKFKKIGYELSARDMKVTTEIGRASVLVSLNYPITITKENVKESISDFSVNLEYPLGSLYEVSQDVLDSETEFGEFDQLTYMLYKEGQYMIYKLRPYPDKLYRLKTKDNPYIFQFFVEGEPS